MHSNDFKTEKEIMEESIVTLSKVKENLEKVAIIDDNKMLEIAVNRLDTAITILNQETNKQNKQN
jgi:hypothetical protein